MLSIFRYILQSINISENNFDLAHNNYSTRESISHYLLSENIEVFIF